MPDPAPELAHQVHGPREGPAVVLLHGFPFDRRMWRMQVGPLSAAGLRVVVPDLPGFGSSEVPEASVDGMARRVLRLLDRLHVAKATVVGFSMGGYVALALAAQDPGRLDGLALLDTRANADAPEARAKRDAAIADVQAHGVRALVAKQVEAQLTPSTRASHRLLVEEVRGLMLRQPKDAVVAALQAMRDRPDRTALLPTLGVPALVLAGAQDAVTPPDAAKAMADALPRPTLRIVDGAAHLSPMERPREVNEALLDWLRSP